jgi:hypothetical protein
MNRANLFHDECPEPVPLKIRHVLSGHLFRVGGPVTSLAVPSARPLALPSARPPPKAALLSA